MVTLNNQLYGGVLALLLTTQDIVINKVQLSNLEFNLPKQSNIDYQIVLDNISNRRKVFYNKYKKASLEEKIIIESEAEKYIFDILTKELFPLWYGTPWTYEGHTKIPKQDSIACGYFVSTLLKDVGFNLDRNRMAIQPAGYIIKNLVSNNMIISKNESISKFIEIIKENGNGLYLVGLDYHVGFIVNTNSQINFVHSSYYNPPLSVISESVESSLALIESRYKMVGKLLDKNMIQEWILNKRIPTEYDYFEKEL